MAHSEQVAAGGTTATAETLASVGRSSGWRIAFGVITLLIGLVVMIWPGPTVLVLALMLGLQLIIAGIFWLVAAFAQEVTGGGRALLALLGVASILVGVLCLRAPFQTVAVLALLLGLTWLVGGVIEVFNGLGGAGGWAVFSGFVSIAIGILVLAYPVSSVIAMSWLFGVVLAVYGVVAIVGAVAANRRVGAATRGPVAAPGRPAVT